MITITDYNHVLIVVVVVEQMEENGKFQRSPQKTPPSKRQPLDKSPEQVQSSPIRPISPFPHFPNSPNPAAGEGAKLTVTYHSIYILVQEGHGRQQQAEADGVSLPVCSPITGT